MAFLTMEYHCIIIFILFSFFKSTFTDSGDVRSWKDQHPQARGQVLYTYKLSCYSCMSPYLEDQFMYISHLYRRPHAFTEKCDFNNFDGKYMRTRNCTDLCVSLRMNDKVGGRRRYGYMRGCMSDIIHYNRSVIRENTGCYSVRLRDLFVSSDRYAFEPHDQVELCPCHKQYCNFSTSYTTPYSLIAFTSLILMIFSFFNNNNNCFIYSCKTYHLPSYELSSFCKSSAISFNDLERQHRRISQKMVLEIGVS